MELQPKGSGTTPYSRGLDGRAVLRSSLREYLCSEAMHALGVPTTRCLSLIASPEPVYRETTETAAVVCRVAPSFARFGQFEFFRHHGRTNRLAPLADHVIAEHYPHLQGRPDRHAAWLTEVVERTARLMAQWQSLGFCHGVMNTDNFSVLGLTLDYGPFGFMDRFRQFHVCNHSDSEGRYAYYAQPEVGQWNCSRLLRIWPEITSRFWVVLDPRNQASPTSSEEAFEAGVQSLLWNNRGNPKQALDSVRLQRRHISAVEVRIGGCHNSEAEGNCVAARRGGEPLEANLQSVVKRTRFGALS
jgi:uncharacterized protein YdiU (UPF0061 family)